jgi:hypothetical protein
MPEDVEQMVGICDVCGRVSEGTCNPNSAEPLSYTIKLFMRGLFTNEGWDNRDHKLLCYACAAKHDQPPPKARDRQK